MEVDFGESWADIAGAPCKVKYLVATLPFSNAYFAKAYPVERLESLLDGIESAFKYFRGVVDRVVLDNTSLAVKNVLAGRDRVQTEAFEAFRGAYPFRAEFCAPAKGWEKGSVENGVKYVRNLVFRPRLAVESWAALNATIRTELEADLPTRHLDDGRPVQEALALEQQHLRALPEHLPATCRIVARVADKFGHVRVDHVTYSVPVRHAWRPRAARTRPCPRRRPTGRSAPCRGRPRPGRERAAPPISAAAPAARRDERTGSARTATSWRRGVGSPRQSRAAWMEGWSGAQCTAPADPQKRIRYAVPPADSRRRAPAESAV